MDLPDMSTAGGLERPVSAGGRPNAPESGLESAGPSTSDRPEVLPAGRLAKI